MNQELFFNKGKDLDRNMESIYTFNNNEIIYDSFIDKNHILKLNIENIILKINFKEIIDTQFSLGNIPNNEINILKKYLDVGDFSKAPCGGFVNFYKINNKNLKYVIYSGVKEVSNSRYLVTLHKVLIM
ncbi:hypothetical protein [Flavobacterium sp.]|uniref:hypothetical protein n=2 Tax=Flavobacterium sp. TaxID=239 RepID=UPI0040474ACD